MSILSKYKVSDLPLPRPLITLRSPGDTLFSSIKALTTNHVLSAPVLSEDGSKVLGVLDALDIVATAVELSAAGRELEDISVAEIMGKGRPAGVAHAEVSIDEPLDKVLELVSGPARRAVVLGTDGRPESVVTQSVLLQFIHSKKEEIDSLKNCGTAQDHCSSGAVCVNESESALKAFETINKVGVWSVAIVDEAGCMVSVISATDLVVGLSHMADKSHALSSLANISVVDLVSVNRQFDTKDKASTVSARPDQSVESILEKLSACRVHRVVVCVNRKPVGVLSLTDICKAVANLQ